MSIESFTSQYNFYDAINFPHGFNRAGVFTTQESEILSRCGYIINQLLLGKLKPEGKEQKYIIAVSQGKRVPNTAVEKAWYKYLHGINGRVVKYSAMSTTSGERNDEYEYEDDSDY